MESDFVSDSEIMAAIEADRLANNPNRWTAMDELVKRVADDAACMPLDNPYELCGFPSECLDDLNSGDLARVRTALDSIWVCFENDSGR